MRFYRLAKVHHAKTALEAFSGEGASRFPGRWNLKGDRAVYCSDTLAGACLETLVHLRPLPRVFPPSVYFEFDLAELHIEQVDTAKLPVSWNHAVVSNETRDFGSAFIRSSRSVALLIPTAIIPLGYNILLNPCHKDFDIGTVRGPFPFFYDPRLE